MDEQQWRNEATLDAPDTPAAAVTTVPVAASKPKRHIPWLWVWIGMGLLILATAVLIILWLRQTIDKSRLSSQANDVKIQSVDLGAISGNSSSIDLNTADKVVINGQLQSNEGIVITPTDQPAVATLGQLYVDQTSREIRYYNGEGFVSLLTSDADLITQGEVEALIAANTAAPAPGGVSSLQGQTGPLTLLGTGGLTVTGAGGNVTLNLPQNLAVTANPIFAGMTLSGLSGNGVVVTGASSALQSVTAVSPGLCLISTAGLPTFDSCVGGGASVASLNGLTGALILANSSATSGDTITIDNASTSAKGIAQFNATNFSVSSGTVNTIQDIATTSTPTFAGVLTNSIDRATAGTLTLGATTATAISLNKNTTVAGGSSLTVAGGNFSQTGSGTFSTGTGAVSLNGPTTVSNTNPLLNQQFTVNGTVLFQTMVNDQAAFVIQNATGGEILGVDTTSIANLISVNNSFTTSNPSTWGGTPGPGICTTPAQEDTDEDGDIDGDDATPMPNCVDPWFAIGAPTPVPSTFERDPNSSFDINSGSLRIVNNGNATTNVQGAGYAVALAANRTYTLTIRARSNITQNQTLRLGYYTGSDLSTKVEPGGTCNTGNAYTINSLWKTISCTFTTGGSGAAGIFVRTTRNNGDWSLDKVVLQEGNYVPLNNGIINASATTIITTTAESAFRVQGTDTAHAILNVDTTSGTTVFRPVVNETDTLQVRNADDALVFSVRAGAAGTVSLWTETANSIAGSNSNRRAKFQGASATTSTGSTYGYIIGGTSGGNNAENTVFFTELRGVGTEEWQAGKNNGLPERQSHGVVTAKGYIYVIGGSGDDQQGTDTVYYNKIKSDGTLEFDTWQQASSLNTARTQIEAVYYQGYIYVFHGSTTEQGSANITSVERAAVAADGTLSTWTATSHVGLDPLRNYGVGVSNGFIYVVGGVDASGIRNNKVYYAHVDGPAGALSSWSDSGSTVMNNAVDGGSVVINKGYMYVIGGNTGASAISKVQYTPLSTEGGVEGWSVSELMDVNGNAKQRRDAGVILYNDTIYYIGGAGGGNVSNKILYTNASGTSSAVNVNGSLTVATDALVKGNLKVVNAVDSTSAFQVSNAQGGQLLNVDTLNSAITLNGVNSGELRNWLTTTPLDDGRAAHGAVAVNGYVYAVSGSSLDTVSYAKIKTDGSLGEWTDNAVNLPDHKNFAGVATSNGYIYVVGGYGSVNDSPTDTIYYGKPNIDGSISSWKTSANDLDTAVGAPAVSIANGYMYVSGGAVGDLTGGAPTNPDDVVQYAKLNPDGSLGAFNTTTSLYNNEERMGGRSAVANGYLYYTGGDNGSGAQDDVYYAPLNNDGTIGSWSQTNSNPEAKAYHSTFILNGYLYTVGGTNDDYGDTNDSTQTINYGKLEGDGDITQWFSATEPMLDAVQSHASVVANGYVYVLGGYGPSKIVMFATASRVSVGGSLDLVGLGSRTLSDAGGGGELTAGNTTIVGTLDVRNAATFSQSLSVGGIFTAHDDVLLQSDNDSANAFQVQNSSGTVLLGVNAAAGQVNVNSDMLFGTTNSIYVNNIIQTANGQDLNIDAGNNVITFTAGGRTFILPTTGPSSQTICTTGISCAEGGGQAVLLASGSAQTNNTSDSAIFINATSTGHHLQLQSAGTDVFVVDSAGQLTLGTPNSIGGSIVFSDGTSAYTVTLDVSTLTGNRTFSFPDEASGEICVSSGNCAGAGSAVTAPVAGTTNRIAKFTGGQAIGDSNISDDGTAVTIQGTDGLVLGQDSTINGKIRFWYSGDSYSVVLEAGGLTNDQTITLPDASGEICVSSGNCFGSGSGATLQAAYNAGNTITTTDNRNLTFTLADTSTDSNFIVNIQGANSVKFQDGGTDIFTAADGGVFTLKSTSNSSSAFVLQNNSDVALLTADASAMKLKIGTGTPTLGSATSGGLFVTDAAEFAGAIRIGDGTNNATFDGTTKQLRFTGTARNTKTIFIAAEYANAVLDADGGSNTGTMTAGYDSSARMNYYKWTTSQASSQDYDIVLQILVPRDFSAWSGDMTVRLCASNNTASAIVATVTDTAGSAQTPQNIANTSGACTGYNSGTAVTLSGTYTAGSYFTLRLHLTSPTSGDIRVGNISMDYLSSF